MMGDVVPKGDFAFLPHRRYGDRTAALSAKRTLPKLSGESKMEGAEAPIHFPNPSLWGSS